MFDKILIACSEGGGEIACRTFEISGTISLLNYERNLSANRIKD